MSTSRVDFNDFSSSPSSDEDDAPREISVSASRQQGISQIKTIQDSIRRSKENEKEKRRQRNEKFKVQKEKKLTELSKRKLPDHVLAAVSAKSAKKITQEALQSAADKSEDEDEDDEVVDEDDNSGHKEDDQSDSGVDTDSHILSGDYIPLGSTSGLALVIPEVATKKSQAATQQVLSFKHNRLYNQSNIPRENAKQRRAKMAKRRAVQMV